MNLFGPSEVCAYPSGLERENVTEFICQKDQSSVKESLSPKAHCFYFPVQLLEPLRGSQTV